MLLRHFPYDKPLSFYPFLSIDCIYSTLPSCGINLTMVTIYIAIYFHLPCNNIHDGKFPIISYFLFISRRFENIAFSLCIININIDIYDLTILHRSTKVWATYARGGNNIGRYHIWNKRWQRNSSAANI